jgi:pyruvate dehydrogenase phosphatase
MTACTGDSRAVLGRYNSSSATYTCEPLSVDQTGRNPKELARVRAEHPGEPDCISEKTGRVLGLEPTRVFGDSLWKWDAAKQGKANQQFFGYKPLARSKTPPYVTAEPEVTETFVSNGDFLILASDGLWDHFSSEDAVTCVEQWMKAARKVGDPVANKTTVFVREEGKNTVEWAATPEHFVFEDTNAATHLARNALGGSRRDLFYTVMNTEPPLSRYARDDITVTVVFFGDIPR